MVAMRDSSGMALAVERFAGWEPLGFEAGDENWYRFVANGPAAKTDPSGLATAEGATWTTPTNPDVNDVVANYHDLGRFSCGFRLSLQFQFPDRMGVQIVDAIMRYSKGETLPPQMLIPTRLYRQADARTDPELTGTEPVQPGSP